MSDGPRNARPQQGGGRKYVWGTEPVESFDSVTTILGAVLAKPALPRWAAKVAGEYTASHMKFLYGVWKEDGEDAVVQLVKQAPWKIRDDAADKGTLVHALAEATSLGQVPTVPDNVAGYVLAWSHWVEDFGVEFEAAEATCYSRAGRYAATFDCIVKCRLGTLLVDYKTGKDVYPEASLQLTAYRHAEFVGLPDGSEEPMPTVDGTYVLHLMDGTYDFVPVRSDAMQLEAWHAVRFLHDWAKQADLIGASAGGRLL